jgi:hypothetical protein
MAIYYQKNNHIVVQRHEKLPPISGVPVDTPETFSIDNIDTFSDIGLLQASLDFGADSYIRNRVTYKPIFKLYNSFYQ